MSHSADSYRSASRRLHRVIANYFAMRGWTAGADCVVIDRRILEPLFDLERIKTARVEWITEDMRRWFPHVHSLEYQDKNSVGVIYLSRVPLDDYMTGAMSDESRVEMMREGGVKAIIFRDPEAFDLSEAGILSSSTLWAAGVKLPPTHEPKAPPKPLKPVAVTGGVEI